MNIRGRQRGVVSRGTRTGAIPSILSPAPRGRHPGVETTNAPRQGSHDPFFAGLLLGLMVAVLVGFGLVMLYSTVGFDVRMGGKFLRQAAWAGIGLLAGAVCLAIGYRRLLQVRSLLLAAVCVPLLYLAAASILSHLLGHNVLPFAVRVKGAFRWIGVHGVRMQPSEAAKTILILFLAGYYNRNARKVGTFLRGFLIPMGIAGSVVVLIFLGRDLSTSVIAGGIAGVIAFVAGVRLRWLGLAVIMAGALVYVAVTSDPERLSRITAFTNPEEHARDEGFQLWYSQLAIGSGGMTGLGLTRSRMKRYYLPESYTDFIFAVVGEELGFASIVCAVIVYLTLVGICCWTAIRAPDREGMLLCTGIAASYAFHAFINLTVVSGLGPTTGVTAPFVSYGGSNMIMALVDAALVGSVLREIHRRNLAPVGAPTASAPGLLTQQRRNTPPAGI